MDTAHLTKARGLLFLDRKKWCKKGCHTSLSCDMPHPDVSNPKTLDRLTLAVRAINLSVGNMLTVMERLDWMQKQASKDKHIELLWSEYAQADIDYWHVNFRSSLDQVARVISGLANKNGQVPLGFHKLYNDAQKSDKQFVKKLGGDWLKLLQSVTWFDQIVCVRDELVHRGGQTLVFGKPSDGILFQAYSGRSRKLVRIKPLMYNENVVHFERYAAHLMAHLMVFLEEFAIIVYKRMDRARNPNDTARACHPGYLIFHSWIKSTLNAVAADVGNGIAV